ncbi:hypothetical protein JDV02_009009 [Purpureocillium takamizusanense]|uniref:Tat pathway signal sequence n=1 Tax=Purpureocillium takamizusanense TaxID=2060973 RepID=A0A9Q8QQZ7_9HYPO|nr:uncharacterized protein JDV02_009009 [Purpureocillium takamizusanense]UNI23174.1 hypothetical protein JDV02_009009 [Purpureocillium takamizusanense]
MEHDRESEDDERWDEDAKLVSSRQWERRSNTKVSPTSMYWASFSWTLNVVMALISVSFWWRARHETCPYMWDSRNKPGAYSPANDAVEYIPKIFHNRFDGDISPFQGWPTDESDALWVDLYDKGSSVRIGKESHDQLLNKTTQIPLAGHEEDYFLGIDVFHQLHCLNVIRKAFYPRRYNITMVKPDGTIDFLEWMHVDHCIESLRQSVMCHSDISTVPFRWSETSQALKPRLDSVHVCRNFTKIREWALERHVDVGNMRAQVEHGQVVDYSSTAPDLYKLAEQKIPYDWNKTVDDM